MKSTAVYPFLPRGDFLIYDLEILNAIPPKNDSERVPHISYCDSWHDFANMGIAVICSYDGLTGEFIVTLGDDTNNDGLERFADWSETTNVIGFNSRFFDDGVLDAHGLNVKTSFDLLEEVRLASGQPSEYVPGVTRAGYTLDHCAMSSLGVGKIGGITGAKAPVLWQQGYRSQVINYCMNDVMLCARLLSLWMSSGSLNDPQRPPLKMFLTDASEDFQSFLAEDLQI